MPNNFFTEDNTNAQLQQIIDLLGGAPTNATYFNTLVQLTDNTLTSILAAGAAEKIYITQLLVTNASETVNTVVTINEEGTPIYAGQAQSLGGGFSCSFGDKPLILALGADLKAQCLTTGADVYISINGYVI